MRVKRYKKRRRVRTVLLLAALALFFTYLAYPYFYSFFNIKLNLYGLLRAGDSSTQKNGERVFQIFRDRLVCLQDGVFKMLDGEKNVVLESRLPENYNILGSAGDSIVAIDKGKGIIYGISGEGEVCWEFNLRGKMKRAEVDKDYVCILAQEDGEGFIQIIDGKGNSAVCLPVGNFEVLDISVSGDGRYIAISTLELHQKAILSKLVYYNRTGTILWSKEYRDNIVMKIEIADNQEVIALNEQSLAKFSSKGNIIWERKLDGYAAKALLSPTGLSLITLVEDYNMQQPANSNEKTQLFDERGNGVSEYTLEGKVLGLVEGEGCWAIYSSREIKLIDYRGRELASIHPRGNIERVFLLGNKYLIYISGGGFFSERIVQ